MHTQKPEPMLRCTLAVAACTALQLPSTKRQPLAKPKVAPPQEPFAAAETTRRAALQTTAASIAFAALPAIAKRAPEEQLVWIPVASDVASKPQLAFAQVEKRYGLRFVEYLARILLNYDPASRRWWEARRREAAGASSADQRARKRQQAYSSFVASVELSLARGYLDDAGTAKLFDACRPMFPRTIAGEEDSHSSEPCRRRTSNRQQRVINPRTVPSKSRSTCWRRHTP